MTIPLSVFIIPKNKESRLPRTLEAVEGWAGEIVVVDSGSTDRKSRMRRSPAREFCIGIELVMAGKKFAEQECCHDWVLNIDADEVVTDDLAAEITNPPYK